MIYRLFFKSLSLEKKAIRIQKHGVVVGSRTFNGRDVHLFMVKEFFVEVIYFNDNKEKGIEVLNIYDNHKKLDRYLNTK